ncbi:hypothetical protein U5922_013775 [Aquicoccus sp. G2-2]|uniref:hypothetical protein n=1 Tax=Aquicoccus sp. G2-2 TaxID=3092120 RepID=UPI002AE0A63C|nr:hypothetical protein [Aquicoccus sp. G2-2]MEA1114473.1 hypothetical protein [Aquicoccus sp. G2-2]
MGLIRLIIFGFIGLSVLYFLISIYSRSVRREKLENEWAEEHPGSGSDATEREAFIKRGLAAYDASFRPKLIMLVYVIPTVMVAVIHYMTTYNE